MPQLIQRSYQISFLTPAFLGDATQSGAWRSPPLKALLRQWWRIANALRFEYDIDRLRSEEAKLFGSDSGKGSKSQVRIRLGHWNAGKLDGAPSCGNVVMGNNRVPAALYAGYGPIVAGGKGNPPRLKASPPRAVGALEAAQLDLAFPRESGIEDALTLVNQFGTLGGRSRNGWGSLQVAGDLLTHAVPTVQWREAMNRDWPHALGHDEAGVLIWQSKELPTWEAALQLLAQARADMRRKVRDGLLLAYPSTGGIVKGWGSNDRVPNSMRFKVRRSGQAFAATIFHVPCRPPDRLWNALTADNRSNHPECFKDAHKFLDGHAQFGRVSQ